MFSGHQFSNKEFEKLQETGIAKDYNGETIDIHYKGNYRPISEYNCYHRPFRIVLGISKPLYTKKQLEEIKEKITMDLTLMESTTVCIKAHNFKD